MSWQERFVQKYRKFGIPNLMSYVVVAMLVVYIAESWLQIPISVYLYFSRSLILQGQVWRVVTFLFLPEANNLFFIIISLLFYYMVGRELENSWGNGMFTLFYAIGAVGAIATGFITGYTSNSYLNWSLFLAYAILYPNAQFLLYFIIPIKAKYIALVESILTLVSLVLSIIAGEFYVVLALVLSLLNVLLFFGPHAWATLRRSHVNKKRKKEFERNLRGGRE